MNNSITHKNIFQQLTDYLVKIKSIKTSKALNKNGYPLSEKHICFKAGHNFHKMVEQSNQFSVWGYHKCSRCGIEEHFQYDN